MEIFTGDTINISEWTGFDFYDLCWYWNNQNYKTEGKIGIWIGVSYRVGSALCYCVLTEKVKIIALTTVKNVTQENLKTLKFNRA